VVGDQSDERDRQAVHDRAHARAVCQRQSSSIGDSAVIDVDALTAFIRARIADELTWRPGPDARCVACDAAPGEPCKAPEGAFHVDRGRPDKATTDRAAALTALVAELARTSAEQWDRNNIQIWELAGTAAVAESALCHVAAIWPSHEDYRAEWD
jgi:hypothetical protein